MKQIIRFVAISVFFFSTCQLTQAQLTLDFDLTPEQMAQNLVGEGVEIFNVQVTAVDSSYAYYTSQGTEIGTSSGILLTTGNAINALGPNNDTGLPQDTNPDGTLTCTEADNMAPGDPLLSTANGGIITRDATKFQFDVVPQGDSLRFAFTFGSEEYLEWVGSPFNDVFGFFISGPNVGSQVNIALVPGTNDAVAVNTVNLATNPDFFYDNQNPLGNGVQYDGLTVGLEAVVGDLIPCEVYTLELIIADGTDRCYDSAVFISQIESNPITVLTSTAGGTDFMVEGCNDGIVTFESSFVPTSDLEVNFTIGGSAEFGVDYTTDPDLSPFYDAVNDLYTVTIPSGETTFQFEVMPLDDGLGEGSEEVTISLVDQLCDGLDFQSSVNFVIEEELPLSLTPTEATICNGQCVRLEANTITDGDAAFTWSPLTDLSDPTILDPEVCPSVTTTYTITNTLSDCVATASATITVAEPEIIFDADEVTCQGGNNGALSVTVNEATEPITYIWEFNGTPFGGDTPNLSDLEAGEYCVTIEDAEGCTSTACIDVVELNVLNVSNVEFSDFTCFPISCNGACDGTVELFIDGGISPYSTNLDGTAIAGAQPLFTDLCAGTYTFVITDAIGCELTQTYVLEEPDALEIEVVGSTDVLCTGEETGVITVSATGGCPPFSYDWSHDPNLTSPIATELPAGDFTVTVTDVNGCSSAESVTITINEPVEPISVIGPGVSLFPGGFGVSCPGASDGFISIDIEGGTPPYFPTWVHDQSGTTYINVEDLTDIPCGDYELTIEDDNGCIYTDEVEITCVPDFQIDVTTIQNPCGDPNAGIGEIDVVVSGSNGGPYLYDWTGPSCPCSGPSLTDLLSGDYELTITDTLGCDTTLTISVGTNDLFTVTETLTPASCGGACDGSIEIDIAGGVLDATTWTGPNGFTSEDEDIFNLCAGSYILTAISGNCEEQFVYIITEPTPIDIDFINVVPPICFGQNNGSAEVSVSGGTGILTTVWLEQPECFFNEVIGTAANNLFECTYVVQVTDEAGCSVQDSIFLEAPQVMDIAVELSDFGGPFQISCNGESDGSIDVLVNGGTQDCVEFAPECYFYDWTGCDPVNIPGVSSQTNLPAGSYCVVVTDDNGCVATTEIDLLEPDPIETSGAISDYNGFGVSCNGECDGWIHPEITGGNDFYVIYDWITGDIGDNDPQADTLFNLCPGIYELRVVDNNDCEDVISFELTEPPVLELSVDNITPVSCYDDNDGALSVSATGGSGGYDFDWNNGAFNGPNLVNIPGGVYNLELTDSNGCLLEESIVVNEPDTFIVTLDIPILNGASFTLPCRGDSTAAIFATIQGGVPDLDILWTGENITDPTALSQTNLGAGSYTITVTDADGCIAEATGDITQPNESLIATATVTDILCTNECTGEIDVETTGGIQPYTYIWELDNSGDTLTTSEDLVELCDGLYNVLVSDANGCDTLIMLEVVEPEPILSNAVLSDFNGFNVSCPDNCDGSIEISPTGGTGVITWTWIVNGIDISGAELINGLCAGDVVNLTLTDENDCTIEEVYVISAPEEIQLNEVIQNLTCDGIDQGSIALAPTGGDGNYTYEWTPDFGDVDTITDIDPGQYCVVVTYGNGCSVDACFDVTEPEAITIDEDVTSTACGNCDGTITLNILTGTPPFSITWTGPTTIADDELNPTDLCQGAYTAVISDANNCTFTAEIDVLGVEAILGQGLVVNPLCFGDCDGSITLDIINGTAPYEVVWTNTESGEEVGNSPTLDEICSGTFEVSISDDLGCNVTESYSIVEPTALELTIDAPLQANGYNISSFQGNDGSIEVEINGGTPDYSAAWAGPTPIDIDVLNPEDLTAGDYTITVTDANDCVIDSIITLTQPDDLRLPTGLTPNNDGSNDSYVILGIDQYPDNDFKVFNRWGNLVYEKSNYLNEWQGTNTNGEDLPDGTYYVVFVSQDREFATYVDVRR